MKKQRLDSYVTIPRSIARDWREGKISISERNLLIWLRVEGNPYGVVKVDMNTLAREAFNTSVSKAHINKLLLELRKKRYIHYTVRKGRRGSFEVHLGDWIIPDGSISSLDKKFEEDTNRGEAHSEEGRGAVVSTVLPNGSQNSGPDNPIVNTTSFQKVSSDTGRGSDTDTKQENNNDYHSLENDILTTDYEVNSEIDDKLKRIAESVGEKSMGFIIGIYKRYGDHGVWTMEKVASSLMDYPNARDKGALFNSEVRRMLGIKN